MNQLVVLGLLAAYLVIGVLWTKYQLWRVITLRGGDVLWHYPLSLYPRFPITKLMAVFQTIFWLPVLGIQLVTLLITILVVCSIYILSFFAKVEEKITSF